MASLRLTFPEKDQPTVIALTGARLTIGRLPFNTIQIIDRTVSGFHAELISEHGHYRLHDRGSSNGTYVNGQKISDYHLNEACTIAFGTVEAQFSPEDVGAAEEAETFPSRGEVNAVRQENVEMRATVSALREEIAALRQEHKPAAEGAPTVSREEYEQVVVEREALKEAQLRQEEEFNRLKTDLAVLRRDRLNLQFAYDGAQRELDELRRKLNGEEGKPALAPVQAAAVVAAQADEVRIEVPKPAATIIATPAPAAPETPTPPTEEPSAPEPVAPAAAATLPFKPVSKPFVPGAKPPAPGSLPHKPAAQPAAAAPSAPAAPKPPGAPAESAPAATPAAGVRPTPRPPIVPPGAKPGAASPLPAARPVQRPLPAAKPLTQPTVKLKPMVPPAKVGPKGTQKIGE